MNKNNYFSKIIAQNKKAKPIKGTVKVTITDDNPKRNFDEILQSAKVDALHKKVVLIGNRVVHTTYTIDLISYKRNEIESSEDLETTLKELIKFDTVEKTGFAFAPFGVHPVLFRFNKELGYNGNINGNKLAKLYNKITDEIRESIKENNEI